MPQVSVGEDLVRRAGVSLAGIIGVVVGLVLTTGSMLMLAQQAGLCCWRTKTERASGEKEPLVLI